MTLDTLITAFKHKFPTDSEAFSFLYKRLKDLEKLNARQCVCPTKHRATFYKKKKPLFFPQRVTGGTGFPRHRIGKYPNIVSPLPKIFYQKSIVPGVFADCKYCGRRYYIVSQTIFDGDQSPIRSRLALFLIAEHYKFSRVNGDEILRSYKFYMKTTDLIKSNVSKHLGVDNMSLHSLKRYRDIFTDPSKLDELKSYGLLHYLELSIQNASIILP